MQYHSMMERQPVRFDSQIFRRIICVRVDEREESRYHCKIWDTYKTQAERVAMPRLNSKKSI